jgi:hypothetical protein
MDEAAKPARTVFIIPVHNRRETTLACLRNLAADGVLAWARALVVDDGSTDGTAEAVRAEFPAAEILRGDGSLWWTGATEAGMRRAHAEGAEILVWLNDDTFPLPGACARLVDTARRTGAVTTGQCAIPGGPVVYGGLESIGFDLRLMSVEGDEPVAADSVCGNFVAVPRAVVDRIGFPDGRGLPHAFGDSDYGMRATKAGVAVLVDPMAKAAAAPNAMRNSSSWLLGDIGIGEIWTGLLDRRSYAHAPSYSRFLARHFGVRGAAFWAWTLAKRVPITVLRLCVPRSWLRAAWGGRSRVWKRETEIRQALRRSGHEAAPDKPGRDGERVGKVP